MKFVEAAVNWVIRILLRILFRFDAAELKKIPDAGPMLMIVNHVSVFEGPLLYVYMRPRNTIALAKKQLWDHRVTRFLMRIWRTIPVDRGMMDREAMARCFRVLKQGDFLCIAPEGTRSKDGILKKGKEGIAYIASRGHVPIIPVVTYGFEKFKDYAKRCRRTPIGIKVGNPFEIIPQKGRLSSADRQAITSEMMLRMAQLMPSEYRGGYAKLEAVFHYTRDMN